jgi:hypothetical protein
MLLTAFAANRWVGPMQMRFPPGMDGNLHVG